jgi:Cytochrome c554 and c-prime
VIGGVSLSGSATMGVFRRSRQGAYSCLSLGLILLTASRLASGGDLAPGGSPVWMGTGSCAATACHGGRREPLDLKGSEYAFSEAYDPHTKAYSVLFDDRSIRIEKNFRRLADLESSRPHEDDTCLRCHVHQGYDSKASYARKPQFTVADGAGCEACHGPAGKWLAPHMEYGWGALSDQQKFDSFGMRPTKDLLERGAACAECHIGLGSTDVNHDLIAAGHPRLNFEYGNQLAKLPKHWRIEEDKARNPDYEAKVWVLGQLLSAKASLDLLESRAARSLPDNSTSPWPEFAEYSCFSCHHELVKDGWPSANIAPTSKAGSLQWGTWYSPMTKVLLPVAPGLNLEAPDSSYSLLKAEMTRSLPDAALVVRRAHAASEELGRLAQSLNRGQIRPSEIRPMLEAARNSENEEQPLDWDRAARQYLAIVAFDKALGELEPGRASPLPRFRLEALLKDLDLPRQVEGRKGLFDSPGHWNLDQIKSDFDSLLDPRTSP